MDFSLYEKMPVTDPKKPNTWFEANIRYKVLVSQNFVVELNKENADKIDELIKGDKRYSLHFTKKLYDYYCLLNQGAFPRNDKNAVMDLIIMLDYENSTNIWRYRDKSPYIKQMADYITKQSNRFWERLENGEISLVDDLNPESNKTIGPKSLCSKVCKYFSEYFFEKHNYYISDNVVRHVLPYYLHYYRIEADEKTRTYFDNLRYNELFNYLEKLRESIENNLDRDEIDRIMWYCYRYE